VESPIACKLLSFQLPGFWHGRGQEFESPRAYNSFNHLQILRFVIADGIVAMEGNGPLNGTLVRRGKIVLADDPMAADATCARLVGFEPGQIVHLREGSRFLGNSSHTLVYQAEETVAPPAIAFEVVPEFR
jgi:hypothetical protein